MVLLYRECGIFVRTNFHGFPELYAASEHRRMKKKKEIDRDRVWGREKNKRACRDPNAWYLATTGKNELVGSATREI